MTRFNRLLSLGLTLRAALAPAVGPVLDLLRKGEADLKGGNLAGDKWPAVDTAGSAISGLMGPLSGLIGR